VAPDRYDWAALRVAQGEPEGVAGRSRPSIDDSSLHHHNPWARSIQQLVRRNNESDHDSTGERGQLPIRCRQKALFNQFDFQAVGGSLGCRCGVAEPRRVRQVRDRSSWVHGEDNRHPCGGGVLQSWSQTPASPHQPDLDDFFSSKKHSKTRFRKRCVPRDRIRAANINTRRCSRPSTNHWRPPLARGDSANWAQRGDAEPPAPTSTRPGSSVTHSPVTTGARVRGPGRILDPARASASGAGGLYLTVGGCHVGKPNGRKMIRSGGRRPRTDSTLD